MSVAVGAAAAAEQTGGAGTLAVWLRQISTANNAIYCSDWLLDHASSQLAGAGSATNTAEPCRRCRTSRRWSSHAFCDLSEAGGFLLGVTGLRGEAQGGA